jgi:hypothetical protein
MSNKPSAKEAKELYSELDNIIETIKEKKIEGVSLI